MFHDTTLGSVIEFYNGKSIKPGGEGQYPAYGSNGIIGGSDAYRFEDGIVIGRVGAYCGSVMYCPEKFWASDNTIVAKPKDAGSSTRFFAYLLAGMNLNRHAGGAAQPLVTQTTLKAVAAKVPDADIQHRIASILSAYDDLIENNTRRIAILEEMARRIYEEWFVRFRFPGHENVQMVESELGPVPESWRVRLLGDEVELAYGKALKSEERKPGKVPVYGSSGVVGYHNASLVDGPGIIVGRKGNVGSVHWSDAAFYPIDTVYYVKTAVPLHFIFFNLQRQNFLNNDAAVPGLNRNQAYALPLLLPDKELLARFESQCGTLLSLSRLLANKNANLRTTRDLLLPKLISGELDVSVLPEPEAAAA